MSIKFQELKKYLEKYYIEENSEIVMLEQATPTIKQSFQEIPKIEESDL